MELSELAKKTVTELREMAGQYEDLEGVSGMKKETLIDILCDKLGIQKKVAPPKGIGRKALKEKILTLKKRRNAALEAHDRKALKRSRTLLRRSRHRLRLVVERAERAAKTHHAPAGGETPAPPAS